jgi:hypothetical protein
LAHHDSTNLIEEWRVFLRQNPDARLIVSDAMERTGFAEDEVLFVLIQAWADQNLTAEQQCAFDEWLCPSMSVN